MKDWNLVVRIWHWPNWYFDRFTIFGFHHIVHVIKRLKLWSLFSISSFIRRNILFNTIVVVKIKPYFTLFSARNLQFPHLCKVSLLTWILCIVKHAADSRVNVSNIYTSRQYFKIIFNNLVGRRHIFVFWPNYYVSVTITKTLRSEEHTSELQSPT